MIITKDNENVAPATRMIIKFMKTMMVTKTAMMILEMIDYNDNECYAKNVHENAVHDSKTDNKFMRMILSVENALITTIHIIIGIILTSIVIFTTTIILIINLVTIVVIINFRFNNSRTKFFSARQSVLIVLSLCILSLLAWLKKNGLLMLLMFQS